MLCFDEIKWTYKALSLPISRDGKYVEPEDVLATMKDAVVQVFFELVHSVDLPTAPMTRSQPGLSRF